MEDGGLSSLTFIVVLIAVHALIALSHAALSVSPTSFVHEKADAGSKRANGVLRLNDNLPQLHITSNLVLLLLRVVMFAIATLMVKHPLLALPPEAQEMLVPAISYGIVLVPLALLVYVFGDMIPTAIGRKRAEMLAPIVSLPMRVLVALFSPITRLLLVIENSLSRVAGGGDVAKTVTDEEILSLVDSGQLNGVIENEEKEMIRSVLEFGETLVREVMVPRLDITGVEIDTPLTEAIPEFVDSGHSRIPVYEEKIDNIKGVLYAKDLLNLVHTGELATRSIRDLMRPAYFVPETKRADTLFKEMQARKVHLAIVVDEYGGTAGLVTIEDLVEEIVGDIQDEYDVNEEADYVQLGEDEYIFDASVNLDDFNEIMKSELSTEDNDTLGGYIFGLLGRVPEIGETIDIVEAEQKLVLRVESVEGRRIRKVHVTRYEIEPEADEDEAPKHGGRGERERSHHTEKEEVGSRASH